MRKALSIISLFLLGLLFVGLVIINNELFNSYRVDLTERRIYSLSEGTQAVIEELDEPVNLYYFFSDTATKGMPGLRHYASRVESLLEEYEKRADGKIRLHKIDPIAFSEHEDRAAAFGLTAAGLGRMGESVYFGLAGTNTLDNQAVIAFFDPQKEQFLEYDISKLVYQLSDPEPVHVSVVTDLPVNGAGGPMARQYGGGMLLLEQLSQLFDVEVVSAQDDGLPTNTDVLVLLHPQNLSQAMDYAIDQFAMQQGRILAFIDPHYEARAALSGGGVNPSSVPRLFRHLGINVEGSVLDPALGLDIRDENGAVVKHLGILGLGSQQLNDESIITANLALINGASFGAIRLSNESALTMEVLAHSSDNASLASPADVANTETVSGLSQLLSDTTQSYPLVAKLTGPVTSSFENAPVEGRKHRANGQDATLMVISDADLTADQFWVQQTAFFGETVYTPFANNGDLVINLVESLAGSRALTQIRSRGEFSRPFTRVQALEAKAQAAFVEREAQLQAELNDIDEQLRQLQSQQGPNNALAVSEQQQQIINRFIEKRAAVRKSLRDVRYQLERDIDELGYWIKMGNVAAAPLALIFLLYILARVFRKRAGKAYRRES